MKKKSFSLYYVYPIPETHVIGMRKCQKRPTIEAKETYYRGKRDLL
jgi:hypothetical protein